MGHTVDASQQIKKFAGRLVKREKWSDKEGRDFEVSAYRKIIEGDLTDGEVRGWLAFLGEYIEKEKEKKEGLLKSFTKSSELADTYMHTEEYKKGVCYIDSNFKKDRDKRNRLKERFQ